MHVTYTHPHPHTKTNVVMTNILTLISHTAPVVKIRFVPVT